MQITKKIISKHCQQDSKGVQNSIKCTGKIKSGQCLIACTKSYFQYPNADVASNQPDGISVVAFLLEVNLHCKLIRLKDRGEYCDYRYFHDQPYDPPMQFLKIKFPSSKSFLLEIKQSIGQDESLIYDSIYSSVR